jgi:hypothetical protein
MRPEREEVTESWRNEEIHNLYSSPNIIRKLKSRRMRQEDHIARMGRCEMHTNVWPETLKGRHHLEDLKADGMMI